MKAFGSYVWIEPEKVKEEDGLILTKESKDKYNVGKVLSVGSLVKEKIKKDMIVYYNVSMRKHIELRDKDIVILHEMDVYGEE